MSFRGRPGILDDPGPLARDRQLAADCRQRSSSPPEPFPADPLVIGAVRRPMLSDLPSFSHGTFSNSTESKTAMPRVRTIDQRHSLVTREQ